MRPNENDSYELFDKSSLIIVKGPTSNDIGFVSSVINGDSIDEDDVVDNNETVLLCEVIWLESDRFSTSDDSSTLAGAVFTFCERSFDGDDDAKTKLRDVSVADRTACALRQ